MDRTRRSALLLLLLASLVGCTGNQQHAAPAPHGEAAASEPSPVTPPALPPALASRPLWPEPGVRLATAGGYVVRSYLPFGFKGRMVRPVSTPQGTLLTTQDGDAVYLLGTAPGGGGVILLPEPQLLYRIPLTVGQEWRIQFRVESATWTTAYAVTEVGEAETPAGKLPVVRVRTGSSDGPSTEETWAPGFGLVTVTQAGKVTYAAEAMMKEEPQVFEAVGRLDSSTTALLVDAGEVQLVLDATGQELHRVPVRGIRERFFWQPVGRTELLIKSSPVSGIHSVWIAYAYRNGAFHRVKWLSADEEAAEITATYSGKDGGLISPVFQPGGALLYRPPGATEQQGRTFQWESDSSVFRAVRKESSHSP